MWKKRFTLNLGKGSAAMKMFYPKGSTVLLGATLASETVVPKAVDPLWASDDEIDHDFSSVGGSES